MEEHPSGIPNGMCPKAHLPRATYPVTPTSHTPSCTTHTAHNHLQLCHVLAPPMQLHTAYLWIQVEHLEELLGTVKLPLP